MTAPVAGIDPHQEQSTVGIVDAPGVERACARRVRGRTNREIADELMVSENTVKFHLKQAFRRLGVTNRRDAVRRARERGLLT